MLIKARSISMNTTLKPDLNTLQRAVDIFSSTIGGLSEGFMKASVSLTLQPYPMSLLQSSAAKGGNSLGLNPELGPLVSVRLQAFWGRQFDEKDDRKILILLGNIMAEIRSLAVKEGQAVLFTDMTHAHVSQDPIFTYGPENEEALRKVSEKYDPEGVFQKGIIGGFKLFEENLD